MAGQAVELPQSPDPKPQGTSFAMPHSHLSTSISTGPNYNENSLFWWSNHKFKQLSDLSANWIAVPSFCSPKTHPTTQPFLPHYSPHDHTFPMTLAGSIGPGIIYSSQSNGTPTPGLHILVYNFKRLPLHWRPGWSRDTRPITPAKTYY